MSLDLDAEILGSSSESKPQKLYAEKCLFLTLFASERVNLLSFPNIRLLSVAAQHDRSTTMHFTADDLRLLNHLQEVISDRSYTMEDNDSLLSFLSRHKSNLCDRLSTLTGEFTVNLRFLYDIQRDTFCITFLRCLVGIPGNSYLDFGVLTSDEKDEAFRLSKLAKDPTCSRSVVSELMDMQLLYTKRILQLAGYQKVLQDAGKRGSHAAEKLRL